LARRCPNLIGLGHVGSLRLALRRGLHNGDAHRIQEADACLNHVILQGCRGLRELPGFLQLTPRERIFVLSPRFGPRDAPPCYLRFLKPRGFSVENEDGLDADLEKVAAPEEKA